MNFLYDLFVNMYVQNTMTFCDYFQHLVPQSFWIGEKEINFKVFQTIA